MPDRPTVFVTNWSSRKLHGPGRRWTIMAAPRQRFGEYGEGRVEALTPYPEDLRAVKAHEVSVGYYRESFLAMVREWDADQRLRPGALETILWDRRARPQNVLVEHGDTLCCACSRDEAAAGRCHRVWAAELLRRAGWRVVLDGRELAGVTREWTPVWAGGEDSGA